MPEVCSLKRFLFLFFSLYNKRLSVHVLPATGWRKRVEPPYPQRRARRLRRRYKTVSMNCINGRQSGAYPCFFFLLLHFLASFTHPSISLFYPSILTSVYTVYICVFFFFFSSTITAALPCYAQPRSPPDLQIRKAEQMLYRILSILKRSLTWFASKQSVQLVYAKCVYFFTTSTFLWVCVLLVHKNMMSCTTTCTRE